MKENAKKANYKVILISLTAVFLVAAVIILILLFSNNNKDSKSGSSENSLNAPLISQGESSEQDSREESRQSSKEISEESKEISKDESKTEDSKAESKDEESKGGIVTEESRNEESSENSKEESKSQESSREESKENSKEENKEDEDRKDNYPSNSGAYEQVSIRDEIYYHRKDDSLWSGEYHKDKFDVSWPTETIMMVVDYNEYLEKLKSVSRDIDYGLTSGTETDDDILVPAYTDERMNYLILSQSSTYGWCNLDLIDVTESEDKMTVYGYEITNYGVMATGSGYFIAIPTYMPVGTEIEYVQCHNDEEIANLKEFGSIYDPSREIAYKPVIYLYPTEETNVTVRLLKKENLTCTYPKYRDEWNVLAKPNGDLVDLNTGRNLYSLYYECKNSVHFKVEKDGFVVKGEDAATFLEEKLAVLGLTEREAEEFIIYWLPILEANKYNYIRFADIDDINENMPLELSTEPDSVIRVLMTFKGLDKPITVEEQQLTPAERTGFTVVEWGGTEIR